MQREEEQLKEMQRREAADRAAGEEEARVGFFQQKQQARCGLRVAQEPQA